MAFSYTIKISEAELQAKVLAMMPMEKTAFFITVILSSPKVDLTNGNNEIGIFAQVEVKMLGSIKGSGEVKIIGTLSYEAEKTAFFLHNPKITGLEIKNAAEKVTLSIKKVVEIAARKILATRPIYTLSDDNLKHKLAKSVLKSIKVENEKLHVVLGT
jgi:hypothetical protein